MGNSKTLLKRELGRLEIGMFFEDCNYIPCKITEIRLSTYELCGINLVTGSPSEICVLNHELVIMSEKEATERANYLKKNGWLIYFQEIIVASYLLTMVA